jgi:ring-1,2-phenylacetyl-CoA epoxidase subunit PaaC
LITGSNKIDFILHLADNNHILGHRLGEWCGHGPILEHDIAIINISLDLIGQARLYYQYAAQLLNDGRDEDDLAFLRVENEYLNVLLVEQENGDWGKTIMRQFLYDAFHLPLLKQLAGCSDEHLAAIAEKSVKEVKYHYKYSSEWTLRLGDGTTESHERMQRALDTLWMFSGELTQLSDMERAMEKALGINWFVIKQDSEAKMNDVLREATLVLPENKWMQSGGKQGRHSEHMGYILSEMQHMQRTYPGVKW